ncbi:E2/UBC family protein [Neorhizobium sp. S3-V5DH]|uniref:E2/UBC family protein n=1 Tax=Neorhizobium sp. S3-V5DH TaxID=2485166 RepID=UPI00104E047D|nr:E2/UBC family protein [Neorhizobium sp. S3-V5DH]TCV75940.1 molybdopterin/thiamine biosynthesis adenylyltransferase [Neorhizobium sp. S3-V5DH]
MDKRSALQNIDATLQRIGFQYTGSGVADYSGSISVHGQPIDISLSIPDVSFVQKPRVFLKDRSQIPLETLAHVESGDGICYASGAGLPIDLYRPGEAILRILDEVKRTLELSYRGRAKLEIVDEYQQYWYPKLGVQVLLPKQQSSGGTDGFVFFASRNGQVEFLCLDRRPALRGYDVTFPEPARLRCVSEKLGPGGGIRAPKTLEDLRRWVDGQPALGVNWQVIFNELCQGLTVFFAGPNAFVGVKMEVPKEIATAILRKSIRKQSLTKLLVNRMDKVSVERYAGNWSSLDHVSSRNIPERDNFKNISVALIGGGTIGGYLSRLLVQSGAGMDGRLSIFDNQLLSEGNIGRHVLGFEYIGKPKALALKAELERFHPQVSVRAFNENALDCWSQIANCDLIIDATGEWNVQSALNDRFLAGRDFRAAALLHTWIFMNGAGVQSFLNLRDGLACFRCLKTSFDGRWRYPAGDERHVLNVQPASCGDGSYVPFSADAAVMAASLANRAALDWVSAKPGARLRTIAVDLERGRYQKPVSPTALKSCPACLGNSSSL